MHHTLFHNKENTLPSTPKKNLTTKGKRIPLGGKDHNIGNVNPMKIKKLKSPKRRLEVMKDSTSTTSSTATGKSIDYDEVEIRAKEVPELPYIPLNYTPFTSEDLQNLAQPPMIKFKKLEGSELDDEKDDFSLDFSLDDEIEQRDELPGYMKSTMNSKLKQSDTHNGLSHSEMMKLIGE
jgi:hypothetical protein